MITKNLKKVGNSTISSLFAGIVVIIAMFMVVGCEKDETSVADQQQTVRKPQPISDMEVMQYLPEVVDGRLVFKTIQDYEMAIEELASIGDDNFAEWENDLSFCSMRSCHTLDELEEIGIFDPLFACLINSDGIIQIENYIYKVDPLNNKVFAVKHSDFDINNNFISSKNICIFSTEDNVLDIMEGNESQNAQKTDYCRSKLMGPFDLIMGQADYSIRYVKLGLYYSLNAQIGCNYNCATFTVTLNSNCFWVNTKQSQFNITGTDTGDGSAHVRAYSSTRRLTDYRYSATFETSVPGWVPNPWTDVLTIQCSYN
jgi:hypothetical protein